VNSYDASHHFQRVWEFMQKALQACRLLPEVPPLEERVLRAKLITEEALETVKALGFSPRVFLKHAGAGSVPVELNDMIFVPDREPSLEEIADGCADVMVVTTGTLIACGIPDLPLLKIVDENNLTKVGPGSKIRSDGKVLKPEGYVGPQKEIRALLHRLRNGA
jgi:predicted HAD superfamily Cof-like phosphohydrolase